MSPVSPYPWSRIAAGPWPPIRTCKVTPFVAMSWVRNPLGNGCICSVGHEHVRAKCGRPFWRCWKLSQCQAPGRSIRPTRPPIAGNQLDLNSFASWQILVVPASLHTLWAAMLTLLRRDSVRWGTGYNRGNRKGRYGHSRRFHFCRRLSITYPHQLSDATRGLRSIAAQSASGRTWLSCRA